jgi:hypothetical protein
VALVASELIGTKELAAKLAKLPLGKQINALRASGKATAKIVVEKARGKIPVNKIEKLHKTYKGRLVAPGFAQRSIASKTIVFKNGGGYMTLTGVKREAYYAINFVELRTSRNTPHPWLVPSFRDTQGLQLRAMQPPLKAHIEKVRNGGK